MEKARILESKLIKCPGKSVMTEVICTWDTKTNGEKALTQMECFMPRLCCYGSDDCKWDCLEALDSPCN